MAVRRKPPWWAENPWWDAPVYTEWVRAHAVTFHAAADTLQHHFDRQWWARVFEAVEPNFVAAHLLMQGTITLNFIEVLGSALRLLEGEDGFAAKLAEAKIDDHGATFLELQIAAYLREAGFEVGFPPISKSKTCDIRAEHGDERVAVECKKLEIEEWEHWTRDVMIGALNRPRVPDGHPCDVQIRLNPRLSEIRIDERKHPGFNEAVANAITAKIQAAIWEAASHNPTLPLEFPVKGLGTVALHDPMEKAGSFVQGMEISPVAQLRRLLTNGLFCAIDQLPEDAPGLIVIQCEHLPDPDFARIILDAITESDRGVFDRLAALLIIPTRYFNDDRSALLFVNRYTAHQPAESLKAVCILRDRLQAFVA